jgi:hypothetical protein
MRVPFTLTTQASGLLQFMNDSGIVILQKPKGAFVPVALKVSVLAVALKLKLVIVELLTVSTLNAVPF